MASLLFARDCECDDHWLTEGPALASPRDGLDPGTGSTVVFEETAS